MSDFAFKGQLNNLFRNWRNSFLKEYERLQKDAFGKEDIQEGGSGRNDPPKTSCCSSHPCKPPLRTYEEGNNFVIDAYLPGVAKEDVEVHSTGSAVILTAVRQKKEVKEHSSEILFGKITRTIPIPSGYNPDTCVAEMKEGILKLTFNKVALPTKKIEVK